MSLSIVRRLPGTVTLFALAALAACGDDTPTGGQPTFLDGTEQNPQIGIVVSGRTKAITMFQLGAPLTQQQIALGASDAITVTGAAVRGHRMAVPLGNAASVAVLDLASTRLERAFTFAAGNTTGVAWVDDNTVLAANLIDDYIGRFRLDQSGTQIVDTTHVTPAPTAIVVANDRAYVISGNLDANYTPLGNGVVSVVDPATMRVTGTVAVGQNPQAGAFGPDGKLYVVNTGNYGDIAGTVSVINPQSLAVEATATGFGSGPGSIVIDDDGLAYISSYSYGTIVWNTATRQFVRGPEQPLCARTAAGACRGAADAAVASDGSVHQAHYGSSSTPSYVFRYASRAGSFALQDSVTAGNGPLWIDVRSFR